MLKARYQDILNKISRATRPGAPPVTLIAVSKGQSPEKIRELYELGHRDFGENYAQELREKAELLQKWDCTEIRWHMIGHLQTNKVKTVAPWISVFHAVDSEKIVTELSKRWVEAGSVDPLSVFIEVNIDSEKSKSGVLPSDVHSLVEKIDEAKGLVLQGLMCIPDPEKDTALSFRKLKELESSCKGSRGFLSMGMSSDFEIAIREGATHVRIGTAIFGPRS